MLECVYLDICVVLLENKCSGRIRRKTEKERRNITKPDCKNSLGDIIQSLWNLKKIEVNDSSVCQEIKIA